MALDSNKDRWLAACDLCGDLRLEPLTIPGGRAAYRCANCGLLRLVPTGNGTPRPQPPLPSCIAETFTALAARLAPRSTILLIGEPGLPLAAAAPDMTIHAIVPPGTPVPRDVRAQEASIESAAYISEHFDLIVVSGGLESFPAPSVLFDKARIWLKTEGALLASGANYRSLAARLWKGNWMGRYAGGATHLFTPDTLRKYAARGGFQVRSIEARSTPGLLAELASGTAEPPLLLDALLSPISLASNILNAGDEICMVLQKQGAAVVPIKKIAAERDEAPGLAPAMYTGVRREVIGG
jgi:hypothetical protein